MNAEIYKQEKLPLDFDGEEVRADLTHVDFIVRLSEDNGFYLEYNISGKTMNPFDSQYTGWSSYPEREKC